jgi:hypothetical protein
MKGPVIAAVLHFRKNHFVYRPIWSVGYQNGRLNRKPRLTG